MSQKIRFAVVGAMRGQSFVASAAGLTEEAELVAICDRNPAALEPWQGANGIRCYADYEDVLGDPEVDAVCIATPVPLHASHAIAALQAGKHVLSEVTAAYTLEECWALVEAVERSGLTYMMAENYCFMRPVLMVQNMVDCGFFGELTFASGSYIHDCRDLYFTPEGELTWRGQLRRQPMGNSYPTHSLGPVARWLGINRSDFLATTATWQSRSRAIPHYAARNHPQRPEYAAAEFWQHPDTVTSMLRTENEVLAEIRVDWASARPHQMTRYELQGTKASFTSAADADGPDLIWSADHSPTSDSGVAHSWEPLLKYADDFEHPLWRQHLQAANAAGHGGGDFFTLREFAAAIREQRAPLFDVYDAVTWSALTPLSQQSINEGNASVTYPRFKR